MKRNSVSVVKEIVGKTLLSFPETRNSDKVLYVRVVEAMGLPTSVSLAEWSKKKYPSTESVRRSRQWFQQHFPELKSTKAVQDFKTELVGDYVNEFSGVHP